MTTEEAWVSPRYRSQFGMKLEGSKPVKLDEFISHIRGEESQNLARSLLQDHLDGRLDHYSQEFEVHENWSEHEMDRLFSEVVAPSPSDSMSSMEKTQSPSFSSQSSGLDSPIASNRKWILARGKVTERDPLTGRPLRMIGMNW